MPPAPRTSSNGTLVLAAVLALLVFAALGSAHPGGAWGGGASEPGIEPLAAYEPQVDCSGEKQPGVEAFRDLVLETYPGTRDGGIVRACDQGGRSEHKEGRAWDWMVDVEDEAEAAKAEQLLAWLLASDEDGHAHALARRLGVMYLIWDGEIWSAAEADRGWRPYEGHHPHDDHVHVSFSRAGAAKTTSYWSLEEPAPAPLPAS